MKILKFKGFYQMYKKALLLNQNGDEFLGWTTELFQPATGELIFNTAMTGFVEILRICCHQINFFNFLKWF